MTLPLLLAPALLLLLCPPAGRESGDAFPHETAMNGCTQEDGPAIEIYLSGETYRGQGEPREPYLRIEIERRDWKDLAARKLELMPLSRNAADPRRPIVRAELHDGKNPPSWLKGTLSINRIEPEKTVTGSYEFKDVRGVRWHGKFSAEWVQRWAGCG